jgi:hypothetical protein
MRAFTLQDWITIRSGTSAAVINQPESGWLDLSDYEDVVFWLDVKETLGGTPTMLYQTSPAPDESLFMPLAAAVSMCSLGVAVTKALVASATTPRARYVRWQMTGPVVTPPWDATFRILVTAFGQGM